MDVRTVLDIAGIYGEEMLEEACRKALKDFYTATYNTLIPYIKEISKSRKNEAKPGDIKKHEHGVVRGGLLQKGWRRVMNMELKITTDFGERLAIYINGTTVLADLRQETPDKKCISGRILWRIGHTLYEI